jgi:hypothetical protein
MLLKDTVGPYRVTTGHYYKKEKPCFDPNVAPALKTVFMTTITPIGPFNPLAITQFELESATETNAQQAHKAVVFQLNRVITNLAIQVLAESFAELGKSLQQGAATFPAFADAMNHAKAKEKEPTNQQVENVQVRRAIEGTCDHVDDSQVS